MSLSLRQKTRRRLVPLLAMPLFFAALTYWNTRRFQETASWVVHIHEVLLHFEGMLSSLKDAEAKQRTYLLTDTKSYLPTYQEALSKMAAEYDQLARLTSDNPTQQASVRQLKELLDNRVVFLQKGIDQHTAQFIPEGEQIMNRVRDLAKVVRSEEQRLLTERIQEQDRVNRELNLLYLVGSLVTLAVLFSLYRQILTYTEDRRRAEVQLAAMNSQLEQRVEERTVELRAANNELERSNRDLERFAYAASHDLQEPVRMVKLYSQLLSQRYQSKLDAVGQEYLAFLETGARQMLRLVEDLLSYSRIIQAESEWDLVDCESVVDEAINILRAEIEASGAVITRTALPTIAGVRRDWLQVFQQIIRNAVMYRQSEHVDVQISCVDRSTEWQFSVADNGMGIAPKYHNDIFVIFKRLGRSLPGSGVGLALCKRIVERHGGRIWVESQPSVGSTFFFTVPKRMAAKREDQSIAS
jgi:signal transduction histidine kinase